MDMDVAAITNMKMAQVQQSVGVAMTRKAMDATEQSAAILIEGLERANPAQAFGHSFSARA